jgi:single-stranded-DNA-specific exonuclease
MQPDWQITNGEDLPSPPSPERPEAILKTILKNRGLATDSEREKFLNPPPLQAWTPEKLGLERQELEKASRRLARAKAAEEQILVFGDYDCDGVCAAAILWEALHAGGFKAMPYLPHRLDEGFGLTKESLDNMRKKFPAAGLIITVDNGITNAREVEYARELGFDVIITDHHQRLDESPPAAALIHTTALAGAGVAWELAQIINPDAALQTLDLLTLATIGDMVPLTGPNRAVVYHGLPALNRSSRLGLKSLISEAGLENKTLGVYETGHLLVPRINAAGRLKHPIEALRLLCTQNSDQAAGLAEKLETLNRERQILLSAAVKRARASLLRQEKPPKVIFIADESFHQGIIGLIASRIVDEFARPAVVVSKGEKTSKASARSLPGFDLAQAINSIRPLLIDGGGHALAGGFTAETDRLPQIQSRFDQLAAELDDKPLKPPLRVDLEVEMTDLDWPLFEKIQSMQPFGIGNPAPVFSLRSVAIEQVRWVGRNGQHLRFRLAGSPLGAIGFNLRRQIRQEPGQELKRVAFTIDKNTWRETTSLQLKVKGVQL